MKSSCLVGALVALVSATAVGQPVAKIKDNLFLLEEAYNQEPGVIQHIQALSLRDGGWSYSFTEEWPVPGDLHQVSVTLGLQGLEGSGLPVLGDVLINYRLQALGVGTESIVAAAPRLSLVLPTGRHTLGTGRGAFGLQLNMPVSVDLGRYFTAHLNAGFTLTPSAQSIHGLSRTTVDTALGGALVWLPLSWANALVEVAHFTGDEIAPDGMTLRSSSYVVNPGVRFALDFPSGLQVVPGLSAPIEFRGSQRSVAVFAYLSLEHPLWK